MVVGIALVKDEADIIDRTVGHMLEQVDQVIVADNASTDGTREILQDLDVVLVDDPDPAYYQSRKMTRLAQRAAARGASWVVPFDADEWWYSPHGRIADILTAHPAAAFAPAQLYDHVATARDPASDDPIERIGWRRRNPAELPKMACRACLPVTIEQGNHGATYPVETVHNLLIVRHFPYRSVAQFESKVRNGAAAYAATELPEHQGQHWRDYGRLLDERGTPAMQEIFETWFWSADPERDPELLFDPIAGLE